MDISLHINTDSPTDIASARAVLDFVERGIADPKEPFIPVPQAAAPAPEKKARKPRTSTKSAVKAAVNGRGAATDSGELTQAPGAATAVASADAPAPDFSTPDAAARAVHAKNTKVADVLDLLAPFKVTRVSELSKEQGPEFIAAAKKFLGVA